MKFGKHIFLTVFVFFGVIATILYTSCEKNPCNNVSCLNGGSCNMGVCRCPTGYENTKCQTKSVTRYIGTYVGYSTCNNGTMVIDSAFITADNVAINTVAVKLTSIMPKILHGYVSNNAATYSIIVTNNDSATNYDRIYTITLQSDTKLIISSYVNDLSDPADTIIDKCQFIGTKL